MNYSEQLTAQIERGLAKLEQLSGRFWRQVAGAALSGAFSAAALGTAAVYALEASGHISEAMPQLKKEENFVGSPQFQLVKPDPDVAQSHRQEAGDSAICAVGAGAAGVLLLVATAGFAVAAENTQRKRESVKSQLDYDQDALERHKKYELT